jgi:hypothetical protein
MKILVTSCTGMIAKKLGLEQQIGIRDGIRELIQWAKNNGKI